MILFLIAALSPINLLSMNQDIMLYEVDKSVVVHHDHGTVRGNYAFLSSSFEDPIVSARLQDAVDKKELPFLIAVIAEPLKGKAASTMHYYFSLDTIRGLLKAQNPMTRHPLVNPIKMYGIVYDNRTFGAIPGRPLWAVELGEIPFTALPKDVTLSPILIAVQICKSFAKKAAAYTSKPLPALDSYATCLEMARDETLVALDAASISCFILQYEKLKGELAREGVQLLADRASLDARAATWDKGRKVLAMLAARLARFGYDPGLPVSSSETAGV